MPQTVKNTSLMPHPTPPPNDTALTSVGAITTRLSTDVNLSWFSASGLLTPPINSPFPPPPVHRNMPKEQALDFVAAEHGRRLAQERPARDPADIAAQASQLLDDFLDREKIERHSVPQETRPLLMLLAEGVHLYLEELETIADYVRARQELVQGGTASRVEVTATPVSGVVPSPPSLCSTAFNRKKP